MTDSNNQPPKPEQAGSPAVTGYAVHVDSSGPIDPSTQAAIDKMAGLLRAKELIRTGNAGVDKTGRVVDRREHASAVQILPHQTEARWGVRCGLGWLHRLTPRGEFQAIFRNKSAALALDNSAANAHLKMLKEFAPHLRCRVLPLGRHSDKVSYHADSAGRAHGKDTNDK